MFSSCVFVSQKIRRVKWRPTLKDSLQKSDTFVTGGWDDEENKISVWNNPNLNNISKATEDEKNIDLDPKLCSEIVHSGDVTDLKYINSEVLVASSSMGHVNVYKHQRNNLIISQHQWEYLHNYGFVRGKGTLNKCPCTGLDCRNEDIVTVGEDGRIVFLNIKTKQPLREIKNADSCSINAVMYQKQFEVITANMRGQLKIWDLRNNKNEPVHKFIMAGDQVAVHCLAQYPGQQQVVASGGEDGTLCIWDMRQEQYPVTLMNAHSDALLDLKFHPDYPNQLFTCSQDGTVWHWDASNIQSNQITPLLITHKSKEADVQKAQQLSENNPWLVCDATKHRLEITSLLSLVGSPVNSLDVEGTTLICGTDNESLYTIPKLKVEA